MRNLRIRSRPRIPVMISGDGKNRQRAVAVLVACVLRVELRIPQCPGHRRPALRVRKISQVIQKRRSHRWTRRPAYLRSHPARHRQPWPRQIRIARTPHHVKGHRARARRRKDKIGCCWSGSRKRSPDTLFNACFLGIGLFLILRRHSSFSWPRGTISPADGEDRFKEAVIPTGA